MELHQLPPNSCHGHCFNNMELHQLPPNSCHGHCFNNMELHQLPPNSCHGHCFNNMELHQLPPNSCHGHCFNNEITWSYINYHQTVAMVTVSITWSYINYHQTVAMVTVSITKQHGATSTTTKQLPWSLLQVIKDHHTCDIDSVMFTSDGHTVTRPVQFLGWTLVAAARGHKARQCKTDWLQLYSQPPNVDIYSTVITCSIPTSNSVI